METIFKLPESQKEDLDRFKEQVGGFKSGAVSAAEFRSFRVPQGIYEQRREGAFMLRVRLPAGGLLPHQMRTLARVARSYGNGILHVTTRQDIQVHDVALDDVHPGLVELFAAGLSTKGGGGNTVRNITACYDAGVCVREAFDVSPYAVALTEFLLSDPLSCQLPRKYKIALSGCSEDCAGATVNDLGLVARRRGDELGFAVYVGGGLGARSRVADRLADFVPAEDIHFVAEAVKRVFDKHGNRKNRRRARLRFLIEQIGLDRFRALFETQLSEVRNAGLPAPRVRSLPKRASSAQQSAEAPSEGFALWREKNVTPQKQSGYCLAHVPLPLGDIPADALARLAEVVEQHGEGMARTTQSQNLVIRWVHESELPALHRKLVGLALGATLPPIVRDMVTCAGASTCKLGICLSRGLAEALARGLSQSGLELDSLGDLRINISGCPNACGRHPLGQIGLFGAARRVAGRLVPHYVVQLGGRTREGATRLAEGKDAVPARNVPALLADILRAFRESDEYPDYDSFLDARGREMAGKLISKHKQVPPFEQDKNYYYDWGAEALFSLAGRGPGECGAGVFDLIEVDLASAREALRDGRLLAATVLAARALLVTQGQEARDDGEALGLFARYFIEAGLVAKSFAELINKCRDSVLAREPEERFGADGAEVAALVEGVQGLYGSMDQSLRFRAMVEPGESGPEAAPAEQADVAREANFHGVACPLDYVKAKLMLDQVQSGQVISVLLDEEGSRKVPTSAEKDGHEVLSVAPAGDQWRVLIRKGH